MEGATSFPDDSAHVPSSHHHEHGESTITNTGGNTLTLTQSTLSVGTRKSWEECAKREVEEETGLVLRNITFAHVNNNVMSDKLHYITIFMRAEVPEVRSRARFRRLPSSPEAGTPPCFQYGRRQTCVLSFPPQDAEAKVMEPHKCERWDWMTWPECPRPVFMPLEQLLARAADGTFSPFPAAAA